MATDPDRRVSSTGTSRYDPRENAWLWLVGVAGVIAVLLVLLALFGAFDEVADTATTPPPATTEDGTAVPAAILG
jgi:hypothetical protein